jgi:hypothetical protein
MRASMDCPEWEDEEGDESLFAGKKPKGWMPRVYSEERDTVVGRRYERVALVELPERMKAGEAFDWAQQNQPEPLDEWYEEPEFVSDGGKPGSDTEQSTLYLTEVICTHCGETTTFAHRDEIAALDQDAAWPDVTNCPKCCAYYPDDLAEAIVTVHEAEIDDTPEIRTDGGVDQADSERNEDLVHDGICPVCGEPFTDGFAEVEEGESYKGRICVTEKDEDGNDGTMLVHLTGDEDDEQEIATDGGVDQPDSEQFVEVNRAQVKADEFRQLAEAFAGLAEQGALRIGDGELWAQAVNGSGTVAMEASLDAECDGSSSEVGFETDGLDEALKWAGPGLAVRVEEDKIVFHDADGWYNEIEQVNVRPARLYDLQEKLDTFEIVTDATSRTWEAVGALWSVANAADGSVRLVESDVGLAVEGKDGVDEEWEYRQELDADVADFSETEGVYAAGLLKDGIEGLPTDGEVRIRYGDFTPISFVTDAGVHAMVAPRKERGSDD